MKKSDFLRMIRQHLAVGNRKERLMMKEYESPKAELIEFENDCIATSGNEWGNACGYKDKGNDSVEDDDCSLWQEVDPSDVALP